MEAPEHIKLGEEALKRSKDSLTDLATSAHLVQTAIAHSLLALTNQIEHVIVTSEVPGYRFGTPQPAFPEHAHDEPCDPDCMLDAGHRGSCGV